MAFSFTGDAPLDDKLPLEDNAMTSNFDLLDEEEEEEGEEEEEDISIDLSR